MGKNKIIELQMRNFMLFKYHIGNVSERQIQLNQHF